MASKRKWDQEAPEGEEYEPTPKAVKQEDGKTASEAAAAAAAIAAKIAAQFAGGAFGGGGTGGKDVHDGEFTHDIDINDVRNRYLLTKGSTQDQIHEETGASVSNKGVWYPDRSKATERDPPLYLHISANSKEQLDKAIAKVNELIQTDLGSLTEDKNQPRVRRKWPEEKLPVNLEILRNFNVRAKVVGPSGMFVKYIQQETSTRVQIKGAGSGFVEQETGKESDEPMHIHISGPDEQGVARAKFLTEDLLEKVREEHAKAKTIQQQQQMELHQAQMAYAYASGYGGYNMAQQPPGQAPPPPPGDAPPPPPGAPPPAPDGNQPPTPSGTPGAGQTSNDAEAYARYWAAHGYDVNSPEFKQWQAQQQQQYAQYYAQYSGAAGASAQGSAASPPPPPDGQPPPPPGEPAPPPPPS